MRGEAEVHEDSESSGVVIGGAGRGAAQRIIDPAQEPGEARLRNPRDPCRSRRLRTLPRSALGRSSYGTRGASRIRALAKV